MSMLEHALAYAARGWPVFPCHPNDKRPLVKSPNKGEGGYKLASTDPEQIRRWWRSWPDAMIGVPTGQAVGAVVLDVDPKDGDTPGAVLARICAIIGEKLPPAPMTRTPRGGLHLWFAISKDVQVGNRGGIIPGVDVRGEGTGYVVLPPSVRRGPKAAKEGCDGVAYRWEEDAGLDDFAPPAASEALLRFFTEKTDQSPRSGDAPLSSAPQPHRPADDPRADAVRKFVLSAFDAEIRKVETAPAGQRNIQLNNSAIALGQLVAAGALAQGSVAAALEQAAAASGLAKDDGLRSVRATIESGMRLGLSQPRDLSGVGARAASRAARHPAAPQGEQSSGSRGSRGGSPASGGGGGGPPEDAPPADDSPSEGPPAERLALLAEEPQNDTGNGRRLLAHFGAQMLMVRDVGPHYWAGTHWEPIGGREAFLRFAQQTAEYIALEAEHLHPSRAHWRILQDAQAIETVAFDELTVDQKQLRVRAEKIEEALGKRRGERKKFAISCGNSNRLKGMIDQAAPHHTVAPDALDVDPYAVNLLNGTLRFHVVRETEEWDPDAPAEQPKKIYRRHWAARLDPHDPADRIAKLMPVAWDPKATCPKFMAFIEMVQPRQDMRTFLRDFYGYGLLGLTAVQAFVFHYGHGANGKSTFMELIARLQGPYGRMLPAEALTGDSQRRSDQATPEFARLPGARMVRCAELPRGQGFRESTLKMLTGGEPILVRHLNEGFFEFKPIFKVTGSGNDKPSIGGVDEGIWRRMKLVPWEVTIPEAERRDMELVLGEFLDEAPGILNWLIEGALAYLHDGLIVPGEIRQATEAYRDEMDPVGEFLKACIESAPGEEVAARLLYDTYTAWCRDNSVRPFSEKGFASIMLQKGYHKKELRIRKYCDIRILYSPEDNDVPAKQYGHRWEREP